MDKLAADSLGEKERATPLVGEADSSLNEGGEETGEAEKLIIHRRGGPHSPTEEGFLRERSLLGASYLKLYNLL